MTRARNGALLAATVLPALVIAGAAPAQVEGGARAVYVVEASGASLEDLLGAPALGGIAAFGGAALLSTSGVTVHEALVALGSGASQPAGVTVVDAGSLSAGDRADRARIDALAADARSWLDRSTADRVLVIVAVGTPSPSKALAGDTLGAAVVATGRPGAIATAMDAVGARPGSLTSDSTRRDGVIVSADIIATVSAFLGAGAPGVDLGGHVIRTSGSEPPFALHDRYLEQRRLYVPVGTAAALYAIVGGILGIGALALGARMAAAARRSLGWLALSVPALATGLLAAGHLPELTYAAVVPFLAIITVFGTLWTAPLEQRDTTLVPAALGALVLCAFALEAATGWDGMLTPLLGGSQLDGGRFYGMPNVAIGLVVGAGVWVAHRLPTARGVALLVVAALVAGMPLAGSNLGAGVTLFATAGIWWAVRERRRLARWQAIALAGAVAVIGTGVILVAHAVSPVPTHVTRFERTAERSGGVIGTVVDRLGTGFDLLARNPAAWIPVVGLVATLVVVLRPTPALGATFERWPGFRDATLVIALGGVVAYVANDTGAAACGLAFGLALGGMVGVSLLSSAGKMAER